jgi:hypothetical protein
VAVAQRVARCATGLVVGGVEPLTPIVETRPAAHIAAIVSARIRCGVSQPMWWVCIQVRKPLAAEAAAIAQPTHMPYRIVSYLLAGADKGVDKPSPASIRSSRRWRKSAPRPVDTARAARLSLSVSP